jgi:hypothetical protein
MSKYAKCEITADETGFDMEINGRNYGFYSLTTNPKEHIQEAVRDAKDYDYEGICFEQ